MLERVLHDNEAFFFQGHAGPLRRAFAEYSPTTTTIILTEYEPRWCGSRSCAGADLCFCKGLRSEIERSNDETIVRKK